MGPINCNLLSNYSQFLEQSRSSILMYISILFVIIACQSNLQDYGILCAHWNKTSNSNQNNHNNQNNASHQNHQHKSHHHHHNNSLSFAQVNNRSPSNRDDSLGSESHHHHNHQFEQQNQHQHHSLYHLRHHHHHHHHNRRNHEKETRQARAVYLALDNSNYQNYGKFSGNQSTNNNSGSTYNNPYDQPPILEQCCSCDEAKYELVFEGLWSRYTHPDDFPENFLLAHFSDIIGASHSNEFRMWDQDTYATEGVKELAETGSTRRLESELKRVSHKTRTIIKARELHYPTLNSKTSAIFRTDRLHHLVSILSKLGPSPDWMVGVSGLELCLPDCSWALQRVVNLYLWDAGTDSGTSFTAPDSPTRPQEKIHPFRRVNQGQGYSNGSPQATNGQPQSATTWQPSMGDYQANGYDYQRKAYAQQYGGGGGGGSGLQSASLTMEPAGQLYDGGQSMEQAKPYARLTINKIRTFNKTCQESPPDLNYPTPYSVPTPTPIDVGKWSTTRQPPTYRDCRYTDWSDWSTCTSMCGKGIRSRTRAFLHDQAHLSGCTQDMIEKEVCLSECQGNVTCFTKDWSEWSACSVSCGEGTRRRTRQLIGPKRRVCEWVELTEMERCTGASGPQCASEPTEPDGICEVTQWSPWSECSVACGRGTRTRTRRYLKKEYAERCAERLVQKQACTGQSCRHMPRDALNICTKPANPGPCKAHLERWHYDKFRGMCVKFAYGGCLGNSSSRPIDCKLSAWSLWSTCSVPCSDGRRVRSRHIVRKPQFGGKPCDKKLIRQERCKHLPPCPSDNPMIANSTNIKQGNKHSPETGSGGGSSSSSPAFKVSDWRTTTTTTTQGGSMVDEEEDTEENHELGTSRPCEYGGWSDWSECEVVCQPVKEGSNKVRQRLPIDTQGNRCQVLEELYYCDPNIYC